MNINNTYSWHFDGHYAVLTEYRQPVRYTRETLESQVAWIRSKRQSYKTEQAWQADLAKYEAGLALFNQPKTS